MKTSSSLSASIGASSSGSLADAFARERFVNELDENFCVSAGAGVGKTTALTKRIAQLARVYPQRLPKLVVVTFTRAAAEELRIRARDEILSLTEASGEEAISRSALPLLGMAFFGTIHSFCLRIINDHGAALGIPDDVALLDDTTEEHLWNRFIEEEKLEDFLNPSRAVVLRHYRWDVVLDLARYLSAEEMESLAQELGPELPLDFHHCLALSDRHSQKNVRKIQHWLEQWSAHPNFLPFPSIAGGGRAFEETWQRDFAPYEQWVNRAMGDLASAIARAFRRYRMGRGFLSYDDQIYWCDRLLRDSELCDRLRREDYLILLDEAQDTSTAMFSLLVELTRPAGALWGSWPERDDADAPRRGHFCMVGDDQQAIYSRPASMERYQRYVEAFREGSGGVALEFFTTMRCAPSVVSFVNDVFAGKANGSQSFRHLVTLLGSKSDREGAVELLPISQSAEKSGVEGAMVAEVESIASYLVERGLDGLGLENWSQLAVLAPRHQWLATAQDVFARYQLPCFLAEPRCLKRDLPGYSWPVALIYAALLPEDRFELLGVLREIFAISDTDLLRAHRANGGLSLGATDELSLSLGEALEDLRRVRAILDGEGSLAARIESAWEVGNLEGKLGALGAEDEPFREMRASIFEACEREMSVVQWVRQSRRRLLEPVEKPRGDGIELITCHKAKGLEWEGVVVLGLGRGIGYASPSYPQVVWDDEVQRWIVRASARSSGGRAEERSRQEELARLCYVSYTRARQFLLLADSREHYPTSSRRGSNLNFASLCPWPNSWPERMGKFSTPLTEAPAAAVQPYMPLVGESKRAALKSARSIARRTLPHESAEGHVEVNSVQKFDADRSARAAGYGNWWHELMEFFPYQAPPEEQRRYAQSKIDLCFLQETEKSRGQYEWELLAQSTFFVELLCRGKHFLTEPPFSWASSSEIWMEGVIDLVVVDEGGALTVVDWKTNQSLPGESNDALADRLRDIYTGQIAAYEKVLREGFGARMRDCYLYATSVGVWIPMGGK